MSVKMLDLDIAKDLTLLVNTNSACSDIWEMFTTQLQKHFNLSNIDVTLLTDDITFEKHFDEHVNLTISLYNNSLTFREQYLGALVTARKYVFHLNDDYIAYADFDVTEIEKAIKNLENNDISFVKFVRTKYDYIPSVIDDNYFHVNSYVYTQQPCIWKRDVLFNLYKDAPNTGSIGVKGDTIGHTEEHVNQVAINKKIKGVVLYKQEKKRGESHYNCSSVPLVLSALVRGKWNMSEYPELSDLLKMYKIDKNVRGTR